MTLRKRGGAGGVNPRDPRTWPACACGEPGAYLMRVMDPDSERLGDAGAGHRRYFTVCDGCKVVGEACDLAVSSDFRGDEGYA